MSPPKVFISATSADLGPTRQVVKEALLTIGCHPVEQTNFPPDWRSVSQMLREKIGDCQALIHIAGLHYGAEPDPGSLPAGDPRRSYTQMEYGIGCELRRKRGDQQFRVYTFLCPDDFPYHAVPVAEEEEKRKLQAQHRSRIQDGAALYEKPRDPDALQARVLALREEVLTLRAAQDRRLRLALAGVLLIVLALAGIGYGVYQSRQEIADLPTKTAEEVTRQFDPEAVATRLTQEIHARFERDAQAARAAGEKWEAIRDLERSRDAALGRVEEVIRTIRKGLAGNPVPIFIEATRILEEEGEAAALSYLESHKTDQLARADRAAAQVEAAQELLQRELQPLMLQAGLHETRLEWDEALDLMQAVADKAPQWFEVRYKSGVLLTTMARSAEAEPHLRAALRLATTAAEEAVALNDLALLLQATNRLEEAELLMRRALAIYQSHLGTDHPHVATGLNNLAQLLTDTNRLEEAEPLMLRALAIDEASFGSDHPRVARDLSNLALLLRDTNRSDEAEPLLRRALAIDEASYGRNHPEVAIDLNNLALLLLDSNRFDEAEPLMRRTLAIDEAIYGSEHPNVARGLNNLAVLLRDTNRQGAAEPMFRRALEIGEASYGREHPTVAIYLNNAGQLLQATDRLDEAEELMRRSVEILLLTSQRAGYEHSDQQLYIDDYKALLGTMGRDEAEQQAAIDALKESVRQRGSSTPGE